MYCSHFTEFYLNVYKQQLKQLNNKKKKFVIFLRYNAKFHIVILIIKCYIEENLRPKLDKAYELT